MFGVDLVICPPTSSPWRYIERQSLQKLLSFLPNVVEGSSRLHSIGTSFSPHFSVARRGFLATMLIVDRHLNLLMISSVRLDSAKNSGRHTNDMRDGQLEALLAVLLGFERCISLRKPRTKHFCTTINLLMTRRDQS